MCNEKNPLLKLNQIKGHAVMKMAFKWNNAGYAHFPLKSLPLKQTKQEPIVLASSKLIEAKIPLTKRNVSSEVSTTTTSVKSAVETSVGAKTLIRCFSFSFRGFLSWLANTKPLNSCWSYTTKDDNVSPCCPFHCYISNFSKQTWCNSFSIIEKQFLALCNISHSAVTN